MTQKYELVVILDAQPAKEEKDAIMKKVTDAVAKGGGKVINNQVWLLKHKLAFKIKRRTEGTYYMVNVEAEKDAVVKIRQALALNEELLRFAIMKSE
jgi:ribosomal protein S6